MKKSATSTLTISTTAAMSLECMLKVSALIQCFLDKVQPDTLSDVIVFGSAAVNLNGTSLGRDVADLDLFASEAAYTQLKARGDAEEVLTSDGSCFLRLGISDVEVWKDFPGVTYAGVRSRARQVPGSHGLLVAAIEDLCMWKRAQNRTKDHEDIEKMESRSHLRQGTRKTQP